MRRNAREAVVRRAQELSPTRKLSHSVSVPPVSTRQTQPVTSNADKPQRSSSTSRINARGSLDLPPCERALPSVKAQESNSTSTSPPKGYHKFTERLQSYIRSQSHKQPLELISSGAVTKEDRRQRCAHLSMEASTTYEQALLSTRHTSCRSSTLHGQMWTLHSLHVCRCHLVIAAATVQPGTMEGWFRALEVKLWHPIPGQGLHCARRLSLHQAGPHRAWMVWFYPHLRIKLPCRRCSNFAPGDECNHHPIDDEDVHMRRHIGVPLSVKNG